MAERQEVLDRFRQADAAYQAALRDAETLKATRDDAVLALVAEAGMSVRAAAEQTGLSSARVQQLVARARQSH
jgi:DNA-directed RNA polymerase specialized sigma24 family protein